MSGVRIYVDCSFSMGITARGSSRINEALDVVRQVKEAVSLPFSLYGFNTSHFHLPNEVVPSGGSRFHRVLLSSLLHALTGDYDRKVLLFLTDGLDAPVEEMANCLRSLTLDGWLICIKQVGHGWDNKNAMINLRNELRWKKWVKIMPRVEDDDTEELIKLIDDHLSGVSSQSPSPSM